MVENTKHDVTSTGASHALIVSAGHMPVVFFFFLGGLSVFCNITWAIQPDHVGFIRAEAQREMSRLLEKMRLPEKMGS